MYRRKTKTLLLKKRQTTLDAFRKKAREGFEKSGPDSPVPRVKHAYEGDKTSIFGFQNQFIIRDGLMLIPSHSSPKTGFSVMEVKLTALFVSTIYCLHRRRNDCFAEPTRLILLPFFRMRYRASRSHGGYNGGTVLHKVPLREMPRGVAQGHICPHRRTQ